MEFEDYMIYNASGSPWGDAVNWSQYNMTSPWPPLTSQGVHLARLIYWINGVLTNVVIALGLLGNILTIIVLAQRSMKSSTNVYLSGLAMWDTALLVCSIGLYGMDAQTTPGYYNYHVYPYVVAYVYPVYLTSQTAAVWLTVTFTMERYVSVCHPLKSAGWCTVTRAKIIVLGVSLGSSIYNIPRWFDYSTRTVVHPVHNTTYPILTRTEFSHNSVYMKAYLSWLYLPVMCIVPLLVLSILNTCLIRVVRRSRRQHRDVRRLRENNVTIMLVSVIFVFIICQVPAAVYNVAFAVDNHYVTTTLGYRVLSELKNFLVNVNSAVNFILYCALGPNFRKVFIHAFFGRFRRRRDSNTASINNIEMSWPERPVTTSKTPDDETSSNLAMTPPPPPVRHGQFLGRSLSCSPSSQENDWRRQMYKNWLRGDRRSSSSNTDV